MIRGTVTRLAGFGVAYFGLSLLGLAFVEPSARVAVMWPASGLALAVFKRSRRELWPALTAIVFVANLLAQALQRSSLTVAAALAVVNALEPVVAAWVLRRVVGDGPSEQPAGTLWVKGLAAAAVVANGATAVLGAVVVATAFDVSAMNAWSTWWLADGLGMLTVAPMLLGLSSPADRDRVGGPEAAVTVAATAIGVLALWQPFDTNLVPLPYPYLALPLVLWLAVRVGPRLVGVALTAVSLLAALATAHGSGPFARPDLDGMERVLGLQGFLAIAALSALLVGAVVAERRQAERDLSESEERSRLLLSSLPGTIVSLSDHDLRCIDIEGLGLEGMSRDEFLGRPLHDLMAPEAAVRLEPLYRAALQGERSSTSYASRRVGRLYDLDIAPFRRNGEIEGVFVVGRDVTERERALERALEASDAKSAFLANMSHEMRTPLNGVLGMLQLIDGENLTPHERDYLGTAFASGEALLQVINDVLDFSKIEAGRIELEHYDFSPGLVARTTVAAFAPQAAAKGVDLDLEIDESVPDRIHGDGGRMRQVITNLVANAVKFTEHGRVAVRVRSDGAERLHVEVEDTGIGIDAETVESLFESFVQADASTTRRFGGTGLGLSICRQLVELMGGRLAVSSQPGVGSVFSFTAQFEPARGDSGERETAIEPLDGREAHVLVAEDNAVNQRVIQALLAKHNFVAEIVASGAEAVRRVDRARHVAVLMDCQLPELDGYAATREIRAAERDGERIPIVAMTASALAGERQRCLQAGMDDYLSKPLRDDALVSALRRAVPGDVEHVPARPTAAPRIATEAPLVDEAAVAALRAQMPDDFDDLVTIFADTTPPLIAELRAAVEAADRPAIARTAHQVVGSCHYVGAVQLAARARRLETHPEPDLAAVAAIETTLTATCQALSGAQTSA